VSNSPRITPGHRRPSPAILSAAPPPAPAPMARRTEDNARLRMGVVRVCSFCEAKVGDFRRPVGKGNTFAGEIAMHNSFSWAWCTA
jgi:hypothetical protein